MDNSVVEKRKLAKNPARAHSVVDSIKLGAFKGITVPASYLKAIPNYIQKNLRSKKYPNGQSAILKHDENELHIRRHGFKDKLLIDMDGLNTITGIFSECVKKYTHKHFVGSRVVIRKDVTQSEDGKSVTKLALGSYEWESYGEVWSKIQCYCAFLRSLKLDSSKKITIWADTCSEWLCICLALLYLKVPVVTVYSTLVDEAILHALNLTETNGIFVDVKSYLRLIKLLPEVPSIKKIFLIGSFAESDLEKFPCNVERPVLFDVKRKPRLAPKLPKNTLRSQRIPKNLKNVPMFFSVDIDAEDERCYNLDVKDTDENRKNGQNNSSTEDQRFEKADDNSKNIDRSENSATAPDITNPTNPELNSSRSSKQSNPNDDNFAAVDDSDDTTLKCFHISQFIVFGRRYLKNQTLEFETIDKDDLALIMFTSGSSGIPKGVKIQHKSIVATLGSSSYNRSHWFDAIYPAYLPLAHIFEFIAEMSVAANGGAIGYCSPLTLTDTSPMIAPGTKGDLAELRPTVGTFVPLLLERIKKNVVEKVSQRGNFASSVLDYSVNHTRKMRSVSSGAPVVEKLAFSKIRNILGGNFRWAVCGGAPLSPLTQDFANIAFGFPIVQGYGLTETCASGTYGDHDDFSVGNTGPPIHCAEIKLIPWEEGGYFPKDEPNPRGEIVIGGECVSMGYYKNDAATEESFYVDPETKQRWFKTSDIGEFCKNGTIKIIDRKKDIIKLKHGEYISLVLIETIAQQSRYIELCCALPNNDHGFVVLLVMPSRNALQSSVSALNSNLDPKCSVDTIIKDQKCREAVCSDILSYFSGSVHSKFEIPNKILLVDDVWTPETGLLTPSMKVRRTEMKKFYFDMLSI